MVMVASRRLSTLFSSARTCICTVPAFPSEGVMVHQEADFSSALQLVEMEMGTVTVPPFSVKDTWAFPFPSSVTAGSSGVMNVMSKATPLSVAGVHDGKAARTRSGERQMERKRFISK